MKRIAAAVLASIGLVGALGATSAQAADGCPNATYRKGPAANLPECRAWEQVTPVDKGGNDPVNSVPAASSPDGNHLVFGGNANVANGPGSVPYTVYFASGRSSSWSLTKVDPIADFPQDPNYLFGQVTMGFAADGSKALVVSTYKLTAEATDGATNFYVRDLGDGSLTFAASVPGRDAYNSFLSAGSSLVYGANADFSRIAIKYDGLSEIGGGQITKLSIDPNGNPINGTGAGPNFTSAAQPEVSRDGRRVTFAGASFFGAAGLFQRVDRSSTVLISHSRRASDDQSVGVDTGPPWPSTDGTRVDFVSSSTPLTDDGPGPLYRWTAGGSDGTLTDLLAGASPALGAGANGFIILGVSPDGRYVWFSYSGSGSAPPGTAVLDTATKRLKVVADATFSDYLFRLSPDGTKMAALAPQSLTGYDQTSSPACAGGCGEVFTFDAKRPDVPLSCVSCGPAGTRSLGNASIGITNGQFPVPISSAVTDDGRVVFDTPQRLTATDVNSVADVYEYAPGRGSALVSSGASLFPAFLYTQSPSGDDVFFGTDESLVAQDDDSDTDIYDARVNGGLAAQQVARTSGSTCPSGDCPGAQPLLPAAETPATTAFRGQPKSARFRVARVSSAARRAAAASGRLKVSAVVGAAGRLSARAAARSGRRWTTIGRGSTSTRRAGRATLTIRLSRAARRSLARGRTLDVALSVSYSRAPKAVSQSFALAQPRTRSSAKGGAR